MLRQFQLLRISLPKSSRHLTTWSPLATSFNPKAPKKFTSKAKEGLSGFPHLREFSEFVSLQKNAEELTKECAPSATTHPITPTETQPDKLFKRIELEILGYEPRVLDSYQWFVLTAARHFNLQIGKVWAPHTSDKFRFNLLASVHVHKKHQVHYEVRTYHRFINLHKLTGSTADTFLEYIERNLPEGIGMKVTKVECLPKPDFLERPNSE